MAATPKRKTSRSKRNSRRSHDAIKLTKLIVSKQTGELVPAGVVCLDNPKHKDIQIVKQ